jgi:organic radical activating enzyme
MTSERILVKTVEYSITEHCNLTCEHCDHASPLLDTRFVDVEQFRHDVEALADAVHAREFLVIGGEPLLHPRLLEFLDIARASGIAQGITLVTNGTLLHSAPARLWTKIDKLWLSVYPKAAARIDLDAVTRQCQEHQIVLDRRDVTMFRQTLTTTRVDEPDIVQAVYDQCALAHLWCCYSIHEGRFYKCSPAPFIKRLLDVRGIALDDTDDGVTIHGEPRLRERLHEYLCSPSPLKACSYCLGSSGRRFPHHLLNKREAAEALRRDDGPIETLIDVNTLRKRSGWRDSAAVRVGTIESRIG